MEVRLLNLTETQEERKSARDTGWEQALNFQGGGHDCDNLGAERGEQHQPAASRLRPPQGDHGADGSGSPGAVRSARL